MLSLFHDKNSPLRRGITTCFINKTLQTINILRHHHFKSVNFSCFLETANYSHETAVIATCWLFKQSLVLDSCRRVCWDHYSNSLFGVTQEDINDSRRTETCGRDALLLDHRDDDHNRFDLHASLLYFGRRPRLREQCISILHEFSGWSCSPCFI